MKLVGFTLLADAYFLYLRLLHFFLSSGTNGHFPVPLAFALDPNRTIEKDARFCAVPRRGERARAPHCGR